MCDFSCLYIQEWICCEKNIKKTACCTVYYPPCSCSISKNSMLIGPVHLSLKLASSSFFLSFFFFQIFISSQFTMLSLLSLPLLLILLFCYIFPRTFTLQLPLRHCSNELFCALRLLSLANFFLLFTFPFFYLSLLLIFDLALTGYVLFYRFLCYLPFF